MEYDPQNSLLKTDLSSGVDSEEPANTKSHQAIRFRHPRLEDGLAVYQLVKNCPPLDLNSSYLYFLQSSHFANTCLLAERDGEIVGFVSGYRRPDDLHNLFIWQVAVSPAARGKGLAKRLVSALLAKQVQSSIALTAVSCTISPSNLASQGVFKSLAKLHGLTLDVSDFLTLEHFAGQEHEAEQEYTLRAPQNQSLQTLLNFRS